MDNEIINFGNRVRVLLEHLRGIDPGLAQAKEINRIRKYIDSELGILICKYKVSELG